MIIEKLEYVYCVTNRCMPGIVKIGKTFRFPHIRTNELGNFTGCPVPFDLLCYIEV